MFLRKYLLTVCPTIFIVIPDALRVSRNDRRKSSAEQLQPLLADPSHS